MFYKIEGEPYIFQAENKKEFMRNYAKDFFGSLREFKEHLNELNLRIMSFRRLP